MSDQKIENLLNLAAGSTNSEKEKSENLGVGFDPQTDTWEIIVKYTGDILALESMLMNIISSCPYAGTAGLIYISMPHQPVVLAVSISTKATITEMITALSGPNIKPPMVITISFGS